jgi:hypothetical protein
VEKQALNSTIVWLGQEAIENRDATLITSHDMVRVDEIAGGKKA